MTVLRETVLNLLILSEAVVLKFTAFTVMLFESRDISQELIKLMLRVVDGFYMGSVLCLVSALLLLPFV